MTRPRTKTKGVRYSPNAATPIEHTGLSKATSAHWYEARGSITVYVRLASGFTVAARIRRALLADYIKRTEAP